MKTLIKILNFILYLLYVLYVMWYSMAVVFQDVNVFDWFEIFKWSVSFSGEKIDKVVKYPDEIEIRLDDEVISWNYFLMPWMINLHTHAPMSLFKSAWEDLPLHEWLNNKIFPLESKFVTSEMVYYASLWSMVESLRSWVTTMNDMYFFEEDVARAARDINMKVFIGECAFNFPWPSWKNAELVLNEMESVVKKYKDDELVHVTCTPHSPYLTDEKYLLRFKDLSDKYQIPYHIHMAETKKEVSDYMAQYWKTEFEVFDELWLLNSRFIWAHCVHLVDNDLTLLDKTKATVVHCPSSNMKLWSGIARITDMITQWINVAIGTDGSASGNNLNLIQEAESATKIQKWYLQDPAVFKSIDALKSITSNAGRPLWKYFWTIQEWGAADLVLIDCSSPELYPTYDIWAAILYGSSQSDIKSVYVNWKKIVDEWKILTLDVDNIRKEFDKFVWEVQQYLMSK